jgi:hypothetical protein
MGSKSVIVTGHGGQDVYTRYLPGRISENDETLQPEKVYDLSAPAGARLHHEFLKWLFKPAGDIVGENSLRNTLPTSLQFLDFHDWPKGKGIRISRRAPLKIAEQTDSYTPGPLADIASAQYLVLHYEPTDASNESSAEPVLRKFFESHPFKADNPNVFVIVGDRIPSLRLDDSGVPIVYGRPSSLWQKLRQHQSQVTIVCSATSLRRSGAIISRRLSWEQTIEDTISELKRFEPLRVGSKFRHLIIRFGMVAALHLEMPDNGSPAAQFIFAPNAQNLTFRDKFEHGATTAYNSSIVGCLLRETEISSHNMTLDRTTVTKGLRTSLTLNMRWFDLGFPCPASDKFHAKMTVGTDTPEAGERGKSFLNDYFNGSKEGGVRPRDIVDKGYDTLLGTGEIDRDRILAAITVDSQALAARASRSKHQHWQILHQEGQRQRVSRINLGIAICRYGHKNVLNRSLDPKIPDEGHCDINSDDIRKILEQPDYPASEGEVADDQPLAGNAPPLMPYLALAQRLVRGQVPSLYAPLIEFGDLVAIDRDEIESFRSIRNLIKTYVEATDNSPGARRSISIAVFGAPGSGKSFAVNQIARSITESASKNSKRLERIVYNVAQFRTVDDLGQAITRIASINNQQKLPLVFFDEFDCAFDQKPLGWLKYFLSPMQDGTFYGANQTINFGRAIFVFAGGVSRTLADFDPIGGTVTRTAGQHTQGLSDEQRLFKEQKGPDFVSRLRGHIDILSVNPDDTAPKDEHGNPLKPVIRRAFTLRGQLLASGICVEQNGCKVAAIDEDVLYALLTVDHYRHGTRSMEAILQMCTPMDGVIEKASLPSHAQLDMHVDADEFFIRMERGRFRRYLPIKAASITAPIDRSKIRPKVGASKATSKRSRKLKNAIELNETQPKPPQAGAADQPTLRRTRKKSDG